MKSITASIAAIVLVLFGITVQPASAAEVNIPGLWNTGVDASGNKLPTGANDPHWTLVAIDNPDTNAPHCQTFTTARSATVTGSSVQTVGAGGGTVWPYSPGNANWIGARANGLHETSTTCPDPSDSLAGGPNPVDGIGLGDPNQATWPYWTYQMSDFTIPANVDPNTVTLKMQGLVDNFAAVSVNGTKIMDLSVGVSDYSNSVPATSSPVKGVFKNGTNTMTVKLKSGYANAGFVISQLIASAQTYPTLGITKTASASTMEIGKPGSYTIVVKNTGGASATDTSGVITVNDAIPADLTPGEMPQGCSASGQNVTCTTTQSLLADGSNEWRIVLPVTPNKVARDVVNTAYVTGTGTLNCTNSDPCSAQATISTDPSVPNTGLLSARNPIVVVVLSIATAALFWLLTKKYGLFSQKR